jgi:hypothetical protein
MSNATLYVKMGGNSPEPMEPLVLLAAYASGILPDATMASQDRVKWFPVEVIIAFSVLYFERQGQGNLEIISDARSRLERSGIRLDKAAGKVSGTVSTPRVGKSSTAPKRRNKTKASAQQPDRWKRIAWLGAAVVVAGLLVKHVFLQDSAPQQAQARQNVQAPACQEDPTEAATATAETTEHQQAPPGQDEPAATAETQAQRRQARRLKAVLRLRRVREGIEAYRKQVDGDYPFSLKWLVSGDLLAADDLQGTSRELVYFRPPGGKEPTGPHVLVADVTEDLEGSSVVLLADGKLGRIPNKTLRRILAKQKRAAGD